MRWRWRTRSETGAAALHKPFLLFSLQADLPGSASTLIR